MVSHLLVDGTGLKLCCPRNWLVEKHSTRTRRRWRELRIGVDADTGRIVASALTIKDVDDGSQVGPLLDRIEGPIASFTADGAFDRDGVHAKVATRHPDTAVIVPPRSGAVPSDTHDTAPTAIAERCRMAAEASGYNWRALVEAHIARFKRVVGDGCARGQTAAKRPRWPSPSAR